MKVALYGVHNNGSVYCILDIQMGQSRTTILGLTRLALNEYKGTDTTKEQLLDVAERINSIDFRYFYYEEQNAVIMVDIYKNFNPYSKQNMWELDFSIIMETVRGVKSEEQKLDIVVQRLEYNPSSIDISLLEELRYIMEFHYSLQETIIYDMEDFDEVIEGYNFLPSELIKIAERSDIDEDAAFFQFNGHEVLTFNSVLDLFEQNRFTFARFLQFRKNEESIKPILLEMYEDIND